LFYENDEKNPLTEKDMVSPLITPKMVDWYERATEWWLYWDDAGTIIGSKYEATTS